MSDDLVRHRHAKEGAPLMFFWAAVLLLVFVLVESTGSAILARALTSGLIAVVVTLGVYTFTGHSGILSFGHMAFMGVAAYTTALTTIPLPLKENLFQFPSALDFLYRVELHPFVGILLGVVVAMVLALFSGIVLMRLSGIEAAIGILSMLLIVNVILSNWTSVTRGVSTMVGVPQVVTPFWALVGALVTLGVAVAYQKSVFGRRLRSSREDENAASALGVNLIRERRIAYVLSAGMAGLGGGLYAHFAIAFNPSHFFLDRTFLVVAMLVVGGLYSLSGAMTGVLFLSVLVETLRQFEGGVVLFGYNTSLLPGMTEVVTGASLLLALILRPEGLTRSREIRVSTLLRRWLSR